MCVKSEEFKTKQIKKKGEKRNYFETFDIYDTTTHIHSVYIYKVFQINT